MIKKENSFCSLHENLDMIGYNQTKHIAIGGNVTAKKHEVIQISNCHMS